MLLHRVVAAALSLLPVAKAANITWGPCDYLPTLPERVSALVECGVYKAPLCHPGICETPQQGDTTIDVFVKRFRPSEGDPDTLPNLWMLQGALDYIPAAMDWPMTYLHLALSEKATIYTMDFRGTGQSTRLSCEAFDTSSSGTNDMDDALVPECAQQLAEKYGDLAAFSTTSAATDLVTFISKYGNDFSTTLYGLRSGAMWVERVMHLDPPEVTGYVLDSIYSTSGVSPDKFMNMSAMDVPFSDAVDSVLDLCDEDAVCSSHFKKTKGLRATLKHLITKLDKNPKSTCAKLLKTVKTGQDDDPPSFILRYLLGGLIASGGLQPLVPPFVYRMLRCAPKDVDVIKFLIEGLNQAVATEDKGAEMTSPVLANLIQISELWEAPTPSVLEMKQRLEATTLDVWASYTKVSSYCAFSKEKSETCDKLKLGNYKGDGIIYERDEYWNKAAKIPHQASVLILSSETDPMSPSEYSEYQLDALVGKNKELVTFKNTVGGNLIGDDILPICGMQLLITFVEGEGDLSKMDKSCVEVEVKQPFNWTVPTSYLYTYMSTDDAYNGEYDPSFKEKEAAGSTGSSSGTETTGSSSSLGLSGSKLTEIIDFLGGSTSGSVDRVGDPQESLEAISKLKLLEDNSSQQG